MADFCTQCSVDLGAPSGWSDFQGSDIADVLCEGCGWTAVDMEGRCVSRLCEEHSIEVEWFPHNNEQLVAVAAGLMCRRCLNDKHEATEQSAPDCNNPGCNCICARSGD